MDLDMVIHFTENQQFIYMAFAFSSLWNEPIYLYVALNGPPLFQ